MEGQGVTSSLLFCFLKASTEVSHWRARVPSSRRANGWVWALQSSRAAQSTQGYQDRGRHSPPRLSSITATHCLPPWVITSPFTALYTPLGPHEYLPTAKDSEILHKYTFPVECNRKGVRERRESLISRGPAAASRHYHEAVYLSERIPWANRQLNGITIVTFLIYNFSQYSAFYDNGRRKARSRANDPEQQLTGVIIMF